MKKLLQDTSICKYLQKLGQENTLSESCLQDTMKFVQICLYSGNEHESYLASRVRIYKRLAKKTSQMLPPDEMSIVQDIKRCLLQVLIWKGSLKKIVENYDPIQYGWLFDNAENIFKPLLYSGSQFPVKTPVNGTSVCKDERIEEPPNKNNV